METTPRKGIAAAVLLLALWWAWAPPGDATLLAASWEDPRRGPTTVVPDLGRDGVLALAWLPGVGRTRARALVEARP
ncbi:MAG: hypothetical protein ACYTF3_08045, partial [Planctomycetota bacterium]